jgi:hypothetical protein
MLSEIDYVLAKLDWMRAERIWPNGLRYLWTDAFGLVLFVSLYRKLGEQRMASFGAPSTPESSNIAPQATRSAPCLICALG